MAELWPKITELSEKLRKDPASRLFVPLAEEYINAGLLDEAVQVLTDGLKRYPDFLIARATLGKIYFLKGKFAEAKTELEEVVKVNPDNLIALRKLAAIYRQEGLLEKANSCCTTLLAANPKDAEMQQLLEEIKAAQAREEQEENSISLPKVDVSLVSATEHILETGRESPMAVAAPSRDAAPALPLTPSVQPAPRPEPVVESKPPQKVTEQSETGEKAPEELVSPTLAQLYIEQGHYAQAVSIYDELVRREPYNEIYQQARNMALALQEGKAPQAALAPSVQQEEPEAAVVDLTTDPFPDQPPAQAPDRPHDRPNDRAVQRLQAWLQHIQQERRRRVS